jgi:hypothetical protein
MKNKNVQNVLFHILKSYLKEVTRMIKLKQTTMNIWLPNYTDIQMVQICPVVK